MKKQHKLIAVLMAALLWSGSGPAVGTAWAATDSKTVGPMREAYLKTFRPQAASKPVKAKPKVRLATQMTAGENNPEIYSGTPVPQLPYRQADTEEVKDIKDDYNVAHYTTLAAGACIGAYDPKSSPELSYLEDYGWKILPYQVDAGKIEANFMIANNTLHRGNTNVYMIAFRGSATKKDWESNLEVDMVPFGGKTPEEAVAIAATAPKDKNTPMVHRGFSEYTDVVLKTLVDSDGDGIMEMDLFKKMQQDPNSCLLLTGHSLGGAIATMLGERLMSFGMPKERLQVVTFGAPAIGNKAFAEQYGDKLNLLRVTNTADPIPGSLQTFFGNYAQFGTHVKYHLSPVLSEMQHDVAMYLDYSLREYYKTYDRAVAAGIKNPWPTMEITEPDKPLVAVWIESSQQIDKRDYVPDLKRFIASEYRMMLPNYIIAGDAAQLQELAKDDMNAFFSKTKALNADYALVVGIDGKLVQESDKWYMTLEQSLWDVNKKKMITLDSFAKLISPVAGNVQTAIGAVRMGRAELKQHYPWIVTDYSKIREKIYF